MPSLSPDNERVPLRLPRSWSLTTGTNCILTTTVPKVSAFPIICQDLSVSSICKVLRRAWRHEYEFILVIAFPMEVISNWYPVELSKIHAMHVLYEKAVDNLCLLKWKYVSKRLDVGSLLSSGKFIFVWVLQDFAKGPVRCVCRSHVVWLARILTRIQDSWWVIHGCHHSIQACCWLDDCGKSIRGFRYLASSGRVIHLIFRRVYGLPSSSRFCWSVDSMRERRYIWLARVCKKKIESII